MTEQGIHKIEGLRRRWITYRVMAAVAMTAAFGLLAGSLLAHFLSVSLTWGALIFLTALTSILLINKPWLITNQQVAGFLNLNYPELQESTQLVLLPATELNILQSLALSKTEQALTSLQVSHKPFLNRLLLSFSFLLASVLIAAGISKLHHHKLGAAGWIGDQTKSAHASKPEKILPQINGVELIITPPAYIHKPQRTQDRFNLIAEDGGLVTWRIKTNVAIKKAFLIFNDKERIALMDVTDGREWTAQKNIIQPGFYQVSIDGNLSELYQVQVIKDAPPVIHVKSPRQYTYIDAGEAQKVNINAALNDDYGIAGALIVATVAKGRGEGVKFKEYKLTFNNAFSGQPAYDVQKLIGLPALNMEPGDELYFYVQASDTRQQQSRTDVFTVAIQDTAELLNMDGILSASNIKPEFFRSERQIIIDAEKLIKDKDSINVEKYNARSNDLGIDQKLLRLRYGKFLGEEAEDVESPKGKNDLSDPADFSNGVKILKEYTDDHDKAEDAQFFEPAVKAQLKATLTEMWKAELQLRLYKPQAALPFAYKALRLLKDLQQKSRSYVAKTAYNPPPLKPEKRLSGELDKIIQPVTQQEIKAGADQFGSLKSALNVLDQLKITQVLTAAGNRTLQLANQQLSLRASVQPGTYLSALSAMRRILSAQKISLGDIDITEQAIQKTLIPLKVTPSSEQKAADGGLSRSYFKILKQAKP